MKIRIKTNRSFGATIHCDPEAFAVLYGIVFNEALMMRGLLVRETHHERKQPVREAFGTHVSKIKAMAKAAK